MNCSNGAIFARTQPQTLTLLSAETPHHRKLGALLYANNNHSTPFYASSGKFTGEVRNPTTADPAIMEFQVAGHTKEELKRVYVDMVRQNNELAQTILKFGQILGAIDERQLDAVARDNYTTASGSIDVEKRTVATHSKAGNRTPSSDSGYSSSMDHPDPESEDHVVFRGRAEDVVVYRGRPNNHGDADDVVLFRGRSGVEPDFDGPAYLDAEISVTLLSGLEATAYQGRMPEDSLGSATRSIKSPVSEAQGGVQIAPLQLDDGQSTRANSTTSAASSFIYPTQCPDTPATVVCADFADEELMVPIPVCPKSIALEQILHRKGLDRDHREGPSLFNSEAENYDVTEQMYQLYIRNGLRPKAEWSIGMGVYLEDVSASLTDDYQRSGSTDKSKLVTDEKMAEYNSMRQQALAINTFDMNVENTFAADQFHDMLATPQSGFDHDYWPAGNNCWSIRAPQNPLHSQAVHVNHFLVPTTPEVRQQSGQEEPITPLGALWNIHRWLRYMEKIQDKNAKATCFVGRHSPLEKAYLRRNDTLAMADGTITHITLRDGDVFGNPRLGFKDRFPNIPADAFLKPLPLQELPWRKARREYKYTLEAGVGSPVVEMLMRRSDRKQAIHAQITTMGFTP
ncbi:uncharacterized protein EI97DRAFT_442256 [Westerdykella ornata]|uniref:Uncharacterized protein n=1 Tax=Westerdykella ornata TaxID=318751 RepID=A0A6A6JML6_WESOR|nr:uncharacterized protein EI97DRAFT_442256 [Westerdykella ornata]KAF2276896.1 hypothetical protein EI97DRAFT_442256 [Westerdykella ornata]